jgi:5-methylcytosine-specific restriction endonuclease McrA
MDDDDVLSWKKKFRKIIGLIDKIMIDDLTTTRFKNKNDFYSLFYVLFDLTEQKNHKIHQSKYSNIKNALIDLSKNVYLESSNPDLVKYYEGAVNAGDTSSNRKFRHNILTNLIEPYCIERDQRRHFSDFEKQFLWHNSNEKLCGICGKEVISYQDYQIDHIVAWDNGGETNLSNAQITHASCNQSKGNR